MKKLLFLLLLLLLPVVSAQAKKSSGITVGSNTFLTFHKIFFNHSLEVGYRLRMPLREGSNYVWGADLGASYYIPGTDGSGTFIGIPIKIPIARKFAMGSWNMHLGFAAGGHLSFWTKVQYEK